MRVRTILLVGAVAVVALAVAAVAIVSTMDFNQYRGLIAQKAKEATGRDLTIKGDLKLELGLSPAVAVGDVAFANAEWGSRPDMARIGRLEAKVKLLPLIFGDVNVERLVLNDADILLETNRQGRGNWEFVQTAAAEAAKPAPPQAQAGGTALPAINHVDIRNAKVTYRDGQTGDTTSLALERASLAAAAPADPLKLDIAGAFNQLPFQVQGQIGSVQAMSQPGTPFPVDLQARVADAASASVKGTLKQPLAAKGYDLAVAAQGEEIARLARIAGVQLPAVGPFKIEAQVNDGAPGGKPSVPALKADLGKAELVRVQAEGSVRDPLAQQGIALRISADGREIGNLSGFAVPGTAVQVPPIPALGPFKATVSVASGANGRPTIPELKAELGTAALLLATVAGSIQDPMEAKGFNLNIAAEAPELKAVAEKIGANSPVSGPLKLAARVADAGPNRYALSNLSLNAANSDLTGEATLGLGGPKPMVTANLASARVDLTRILPADPGGAPAQRPAGGGPAGQRPDRVFPDDPLPLDALDAANAELRYRAGEIITPSVAVKDANVALTLRDGNLAVRPLGAGLGGGQVTGDLTLAAATGALAARLGGKAIDLGALVKQAQGAENLRGGPTNFDIDLRGTGKSVRALMASLNGSVNLTVGAGAYSDEFTDKLGLQDLLAIISKSVPKQQQTRLNCVVARADIANGVTAWKALVVDTERLTLTGSGRINLGTEQIDMRVENRTKVANLLSLLPPILVQGTLANPRFLPDPVATVTGVAGAVAGTAGGAVGQAAGIVGGLLGQRSGAQPQPAQADPCAGVPGAAAAPAQPAAAQPPAPAQPPQQQQQPEPQPANPLQGIERGLRGIFR